MQNKDVSYYKAFGLVVRSEPELPEMFEIDPTEDFDIDIYHAALPPEPQEDQLNLSRPNLLIASDYFRLKVPQVAHYEVFKKEEVTHVVIDPEADAKWPLVKSWLLGSAVSAALQMNNRFAVHASSVVHQDQVVLFAGNSGHGKSTLATQLVERGFPFFSDDKCVLLWDREKQKFMAEPSLKLIRLWQSSENALANKTHLKGKQQIAQKSDKYQYIISDHLQVSTPRAIGRLFVLGPWLESDDITERELSGIKKLRMLARHTHRYGYIKHLNKQKEHWHQISLLANQISISVLQRGKQTPIQTFADYVAKQIDR